MSAKIAEWSKETVDIKERREREQQDLKQIEHCQPEVGKLRPLINRDKCEAKADCVQVCPYHVFEVRKLSSEERKELAFPSQIKLFVHGGKQAFAINSEECHACGLCVQACPEKAIKLVKAGA